MIQYALYHQAAQSSSPDAEAALKEALQALTRLRPENLVVLVQSGQRAIAAGDRAGATQAFLRVRELLGPTPSPAAAIRPGAGARGARIGRYGRRAGAGDPAGERAQAHARLPAGPARAGAGHPRRSRSSGSWRSRRPRASAIRWRCASARPPWPGTGGRPRARHRRLRRRREARYRLGACGGRPARSDPSRLPVAIRVAGPEAAGITGLLAADLDNDGKLDLIGFGPKRVAFWRGRGDGGFDDATAGGGPRQGRGGGRRRPRLRRRRGSRSRPRRAGDRALPQRPPGSAGRR